MNNLDKQSLAEANELLFEGNEFLLNGDVERAQEAYRKLMTIYRNLPHTGKKRLYRYAMKLQGRIKQKNSYVKKHTDFEMYNGKVIKDLYHLVYVLDTISDSQLRCHVNSVRNDILEWIRYSMQDEELANLLQDITDKEEIKRIVLRHLLLRSLRNAKTVLPFHIVLDGMVLVLE